MKKLYTILFALVAVLGLSAQKTVTFDATKDLGSTSGNTTPDEVTKSGVTITSDDAAFATSSQYRFYKNSTSSISAAEGNIVKIEFTCSASGTANYGPGNFTFDESGEYTYEAAVGTWTGSAAKITFSATGAQVRATKIVVTLDIEGEEEPSEPTPPVEPGEISGTGEGTVASPYDVTRALSLIENKANDASAEVYVTGTISAIDEISTQFGNATYDIVDTADGAALKVYRGYYLGGEKFTAEDQLKVGDKVVVCGKLVLYGTTPEVNTGNKLYSINGETTVGGGETIDPTEPEEPTDPTPSITGIGTVAGNTITFAATDLGLDDTTPVTGIGLVDETIVTFDKANGSNAPAYYTNGSAIRVYAQNTITVTAQKSIVSVVLTYTGSYFGNEPLTVSAGAVSRNAENKTITISGVNAETVQLTNPLNAEGKAGTQLRITNVEITYVSTGIAGVEQQAAAAATYDLSGRRVAAAGKGLYIVGGKKVLVK